MGGVGGGRETGEVRRRESGREGGGREGRREGGRGKGGEGGEDTTNSCYIEVPTIRASN